MYNGNTDRKIKPAARVWKVKGIGDQGFVIPLLGGNTY